MHNKWLHQVVLLLQRMGPVRAAFVASVLASVIAISGKIMPNRDGMLYIEAAELFQKEGLFAAQQVFDWLLLPGLIAVASSLTGLGLETSAYLLSILFVAGVCALMVACSKYQFADSGWAACVVVLALPALNDYRDFISRESGCWFFLFLSFYLVLRWVRQPSWRKAIGAQAAICLAALFRPEALVFLGSLMLWQLLSFRQPDARSRLLMMTAMPVLIALSVLGLLIVGVIYLPERVVSQLSSVNPKYVIQHFKEAADLMAATVLHGLSADEAPAVLFFGLISIIPIKFIGNLGVFVIPLAYGLFSRGGATLLRQWSPLSWVWVTYLVVLAAYLFEMMFLTGRYVVLLDLLVVPLIAVGLLGMYRELSKWRLPIVIAVAAMIVAGVVSTSPKKTHYPAAAAWLSEQEVDADRVYIEDREVAYLAGLSYSKARKGRMSREGLAKALKQGRFDLVLVRDAKKNHDTEKWAKANGLQALESFYDARGRGVLALRPSRSAK